MARPEGFEFRSANSNEMAQFTGLGSYVFASPPGEDDPPSLLLPEWTHCAFHGEKIAASSGVFPFVVRLNGGTAPVHGVTSVGTEPEYRRQGLVRQLMTDLLHRAKDENQVASILLASRGAIYQRFGYGPASSQVGYKFDPRESMFQEQVPVTGRIERLSKTRAMPLAADVFKAYARPRTMLALRVAPVWERFFADVEKEKAYCVVHFDEHEVADGYCIYSTVWKENTQYQQMVCRDLCYTNLNAWRAIWEYLCSHDLVNQITWPSVPEDDPAPGLLLEPRCLNRSVMDQLWMRIVDVEGMLQARGYDVDGEMIIAVDDDEICPWNNGVYQLTIENRQATVVRVKAEPDMICSIHGLASLASGFARASWLSQLGRVKVSDEARLGYFDQMFATRFRPALSFGF